jgi:hypothetical protein
VRQPETDRQADRQADRQTDRQTDKKGDTGDTRPIVIAETLHKICAKVLLRRRSTASAIDEAAGENQFGVGTQNGASRLAMSFTAALLVPTPKKEAEAVASEAAPVEPTPLRNVPVSQRVGVVDDQNNAFNSQSRFSTIKATDKSEALRGTMFERLQHLVYGDPRNVVVWLRARGVASSSMSDRGQMQGDVNGPALFCLTYASSMRASNEELVERHGGRFEDACSLNSYLDDAPAVCSGLVGAPGNFSEVFEMADRHNSEIGMTSNKAKRRIFIPETFDTTLIPALLAEAARIGATVTLDGVVIAGVPIGTDGFVEQKLKEKASKVERIVEASIRFVERFPREGLAVMWGAALERLTWLYCNVEPRLILRAIGARIRKLQLRIVEAASGRSNLPTSAQRIMRLPKCMGPVGCVDPCEASIADYVATALGIVTSSSWITPQLVPGFERAFEDCRDMGGMLSASATTERSWHKDPNSGNLGRAFRDKKGATTRQVMNDPTIVLQRRSDGSLKPRQRLRGRLARGIGIMQRAQLLDDTDCDQLKMLISAQSADGANRVLTATDANAMMQPITDEDFRAELCEQLGLRPLGLETTPAETECAGCGGVLGTLGQHVSTCTVDLMTTLVHNAVVTVFVRAINATTAYTASTPNHGFNEALSIDEREAAEQNDPRCRKRPDVLVLGSGFGLGAGQASFDVMIMRTSCSSYANRAAARARSTKAVGFDVQTTLTRGEREKIGRYYGSIEETRDAVRGIPAGTLFHNDHSNTIHTHIGMSGAAASGQATSALGLARTERMRIRHALREAKIDDATVDDEVKQTPTHPVRPFIMACNGTIGNYSRTFIRAMVRDKADRKRFETELSFALVRAKGVQKRHSTRVFGVGAEARRVRNCDGDEVEIAKRRRLR